MGQNNRERLVSMVRGESGRVPIYRMRRPDGEPLSNPFYYVDEDELRKFVSLVGCGETYLFDSVSSELREEVLRDSPCLVRQEDGRFVAKNPEKEGQVYIIDD